ncbi:hypothetical protein ANCDUO_06660 [Ancylostoma duodenale]|uniref:Uncharacterized protein n=1 Tax=Ancylostoma duodenale TaxID=51022 RepID=A0A0C2D141_9BILA|nr:hypothetical protein ANCDUO_06660 [Ancylostoma duodenale]
MGRTHPSKMRHQFTLRKWFRRDAGPNCLTSSRQNSGLISTFWVTGYSIWSVIETNPCDTSHNSVGSLKEAFLKAWEDIDAEYLLRTVDAFPHRLHECIRRKRDHVEHV